MFLEATDRALAILEANFSTDIEALAVAKSVLGIDAEVTVYDRQPVAVVASLKDSAFPALGVYTAGGTAQSRRQDERLGTVTVVVEYYARRPDQPTLLGKQTELAVEAILRSLDRMAGAGGVVLAGDPEHSVIVEIFGLSRVEGLKTYEDGARVRFPVVAQDTGLT